jgi:hypothetical protein
MTAEAFSRAHNIHFGRQLLSDTSGDGRSGDSLHIDVPHLTSPTLEIKSRAHPPPPRDTLT